MNKFLVLILLASVYFGALGCTEVTNKNKFHDYEGVRRRTRQIDVLRLEELSKAAADAAEPTTVEKEISLSLEECRAMTLENNLDIKAQLIEPSISAKRISEQEAKFESAFSASGSFARTDTPTSTALDGSRVDYQRTDYGVNLPLRTGGTVTFDLAQSRTKTDNVFSTLNPSHSSDFSISLSQPLLRNAGNRVNTHSIRLAGYQSQMVDAQTKLEIIRTVASADRWYWRLYAARRELEVRQQQYELAQTQLEQARRFVEAGERSQIEVIRAEAGVAERLEGIIMSENELRDRERELKKLLNKPGLTMRTPTVLVPVSEADPVHYDLDYDSLLEHALANRMELLEMELQIASDASTLAYLENQMLPLVTLDYTYNINGLGKSRGDAFDVLVDKDFEDHRVGLQMLVPLGNGAARSRKLQAFYQRQQRLVSFQNRKDMIELEVLNAADQLEANWQRILASQQNAILTGRQYEAEKRQFELGLGTSTDVLNAQTALANAQSAEISALAEYQIALVDIAYATGTLLGAAKVDWEPSVP